MSKTALAANHLKLFAAALLAATLGGCAGGSVSHYGEQNHAGPGPMSGMSSQAFADQVYLDGTGPSARRARVETAPVRRIAAEPNTSGVTRPVVNSRPLAIERDPAPQQISASTTGSRSATTDANKPFTDQWWEKERLADARLKSRMNICRGC